MTPLQIRALLEWLETKGKIEAGKPSGMELAQRDLRKETLARRNLDTKDRTLYKQLEDIPLHGETEAKLNIPPSTNLLPVPPPENLPPVLSSAVNPPVVSVSEAGEAEVQWDNRTEVEKYMNPTGISQREIIARRTAPGANLPDPVVEQAIPSFQHQDIPEQRFALSETQKRAANLRKSLAELKNRRRRHQGRTGLPFNPKIWNRNMLPTGGPIQRQLEKRKF